MLDRGAGKHGACGMVARSNGGFLVLFVSWIPACAGMTNREGMT